MKQVEQTPKCLETPWLVMWCMHETCTDESVPKQQVDQKASARKKEKSDQALPANLFDSGIAAEETKKAVPASELAQDILSEDDNNDFEALSKESGIKHFAFQQIDTRMIGPVHANQKCDSQVELLLGNNLRKIMVQRIGDDGIQSVLIVDSVGHVTTLSSPECETMFKRSQWRVFDFAPGETLIDLRNTGSFSKIKLLVCKLPKLKFE